MQKQSPLSLSDPPPPTLAQIWSKNCIQELVSVFFREIAHFLRLIP